MSQLLLKLVILLVKLIFNYQIVEMKVKILNMTCQIYIYVSIICLNVNIAIKTISQTDIQLSNCRNQN